MNHYHLKALVWHETDLSFDWDSKTGELTGKDAEIVAELMAMAQAAGNVSIDPAPAMYDVSDPLTHPDQMAAILGRFWHLPEDLQAVYPKVEAAPVSAEALDENGKVVGSIRILH